MSTLPPPPPPPPLPPQRSLPSPRSAYASDGNWGLGQAWGVLGIYLGAAIATGVAFALIQGVDGKLSGPWLLTLVVVPQMAMLAYLLPTMARRSPDLRRDLRLTFRWSDLGLGFALAFGGLVAGGVVAQIIESILGDPPTAAVADLLDESSDGGGITIWLVLVAVFGATLAPLAEELVFRGLWWSALEKRGHSAVVALWTTSLVFAAFHIELYRFPVLVVLGLALGLGRKITDRLAPCIVAHVIINAIAFTALLVESA